MWIGIHHLATGGTDLRFTLMTQGSMSHEPQPYQSEALGRGGPSLHCGQGPLLHHIFGLLVHAHHGLFGNAQQSWDQLVLTLQLLLRTEQPAVRQNQDCGI